MPTQQAVDIQRPVQSLWRGLLAYRVLALVSSAVVALTALADYALPVASVAVLAVMTTWTAFTGYAYLRERPGEPGRRDRIAVLDLLVTLAVVATTALVETRRRSRPTRRSWVRSGLRVRCWPARWPSARAAAWWRRCCWPW